MMSSFTLRLKPNKKKNVANPLPIPMN